MKKQFGRGLQEWICWMSFYCFYLVLESLLVVVLHSVTAGEGDATLAFSGGPGSASFIRTPQSQIVALAEKDTILRCDFSYPGGRPVSHIIEWSKKEHDVPIFIMYQGYPPHIGEGYEGRLGLAGSESGEKASLLIKKIQREDEGWYECKVQLLNRPPETPKNGSWVYLVVHAPPQIMSGPPGDLYVKVNDEIQLSCDASGTPKPKILWTKDGDAIKLTPRILLTANTLTIRSVTAADVGSYECSARNAEGRVSRTSKLIIASGAVILRPPENLTRLEGDRADLHCKAEGKPNNLTFHWLRNDEPIESSYYTELSSRVVVQTDGTLIINPTAKSDTGKYTCRVTNGIEETPEASAWLAIEFPARITYNPSLQYLPLNLSGIIRCFIEANPSVQFVQWTKDSRVLDIKALPGVSALPNGSLFIEHVTMDHQGQYTCTPYNFHGTGGSSIDMSILVEEPPVFVTIPKAFYQGEQKGAVTMVCAAKEVPGRLKPRIYWRKADGSVISSDRSIRHGGTLKLFNLKKSDHGIYDCVLENDVATLVATTTLLIESTTPHAPTNVTTDVTPFSVTINWRPAYSGGFSQHYVIWYRLFGSSTRQWRTLRVRPDDASSFTVYNLSPDTLYEFQVLSRNQLGDGLFSDPLVVRTLDIDSYATAFPTDASGATYVPTIVKPSGHRPGSPHNLRIDGNSEGVRVNWDGPRNSSVPVMYYMVEYRKQGEQWGRSSDPVSGGRTNFVAKDIQPGSIYEFRVYAFTLTSFSEPSEIQRFTLTYENSGNLSPYIAITAGVVGGVAFFAVTVVAAICCMKCSKKRSTKARYEANNGHRTGNSSVPLNRGMGRNSAGWILWSSLKLMGKACEGTFYLFEIKSQSTSEDLSTRKPLYKRGYSVQVEVTDSPNGELPGSAMSGTSSEAMAIRPVLDNLPSIRRPQMEAPLAETRWSTEIPCYIPYQPTRAEIDRDYVESTVHHPVTSSEKRTSSEVTPRTELSPIVYDREQLYETILRLRSVCSQSQELLETADSGVAMTSTSQNANSEASPSSYPDNSSADASPPGNCTATPDRSPLSSAAYAFALPKPKLSGSFLFGDTPDGNIALRDKPKDAAKRSRSLQYEELQQNDAVTLTRSNTEARCQALMKEFREYKCRKRRNLSSERMYTDMVQAAWHLVKPPLESEC